MVQQVWNCGEPDLLEAFMTFFANLCSFFHFFHGGKNRTIRAIFKGRDTII